MREGIRTAFTRTHTTISSLSRTTERKQGVDESVDAYAYAKFSLCNKVNRNMIESDQNPIFYSRSCFLNSKDMLYHVNPQAFMEALSFARKKESVTKYSQEVKRK